MTTKSIAKQIIDDFIEKLSKNTSLEEPLLNSLRELLDSEKIKKQDIVNLLKEKDKDGNP